MRSSDFKDPAFNRLAEVRVAIEGVLLRDAITNWQNGRGTIDVLDGPLSLMTGAVAQRDRLGVARADLAFHRVIRDAAENDVAGSVWDNILPELEEHLMALALATPDLRIFTRRHYGLRDGVVAVLAEAVSLEVARTLCREHIHGQPSP